MQTAKIVEIFTSIQGEGPYIGYKQLFIRFCGCNLNCKYCDTDFSIKSGKDYTCESLIKIVNQNKNCHSISLTGGEPLLHTDFLQEFLPKTHLPIYLETNSTLYNELSQIINHVDYISADIKLPSCSGNKSCWEEHDKFFKVANCKKLFAKVVFDEKITDNEIIQTAQLAKKHEIELILQPKNEINSTKQNSEFLEIVMNKFLDKYNKIRLIPQVHKYLNLQ